MFGFFTWPFRFMFSCVLGLIGVTSGIPVNHVRLTMHASVVQYGRLKAWLLVIASLIGVLALLIVIGTIAGFTVGR